MEKERRKIRVLYAEDVKEIRETYQEILIKLGYDVYCVGDGDQALEVYKQERFDLLILDLDLPGKKGDEVLKAVRQRGDRIPVIILSMMNRYTLLVDKEYKADEYICKECNVLEFRSRLKKALERVWGDDMVDRLTDRVSFDKRTFILTVDNNEHFLGYVAGNICSIICSNKNKGISLENLCMQIWNYKPKEEKNSKIEEIRTYISKIRGWIEVDSRIKLYKIRGGDYILSIASSEE